MTDLLNQLNTVTGAGIGGIAFFGAWVYMILTWLSSQEFFGGGLFGWLLP
jgi:hypothetical protein